MPPSNSAAFETEVARSFASVDCTSRTGRHIPSYRRLPAPQRPTLRRRPPRDRPDRSAGERRIRTPDQGIPRPSSSRRRRRCRQIRKTYWLATTPGDRGGPPASNGPIMPPLRAGLTKKHWKSTPGRGARQLVRAPPLGSDGVARQPGSGTITKAERHSFGPHKTFQGGAASKYARVYE